MVPRIDCESIAFPNYSLEDHWNRGDAAKAIARGGWQTVILQQGPSALPESQVLLREYTRKFDARHPPCWRENSAVHGVAVLDAPQ